MLNSATSTSKSQSNDQQPQRSGFVPSFDKFRSLFATRRAPTPKAIASDVSIVDEDEGDDPPRFADMNTVETEDEVVIDPTLSEPEINVAGIPPPSPSPPPHEVVAPESPTKRKRHAERPDIYEVSVDDEEEVEVEVEEKKPRRRMARRTKAKAKSPAKKNNKQRLPVPSSEASAPAEPEIVPTTQGAVTAAEELQTTAGPEALQNSPGRGKGTKGQARKESPAAQNDMEDGATPSPEKIAPHTSAKPSAGDTEGVSSILLNPSPIKVARPVARDEPPATPESPESDDEFPDVANIGQKANQEPAEASMKNSSTPAAPVRPGNFSIDLEPLDLMIDLASHVGHTFNKDSEEWEALRKVNKIYTAPAKRLNRALNSINLRCARIGDFKAANDLDAIQDAHAEITELVHSIKDQKILILTERLGNPARGINYLDDVSTRSLLIDLYFNIFPKILRTLDLSAEVYNENGIFDTSSLQEFADLAETYYALATTAVNQPSSSQPKPSQIPPESKSISFQMVRPTRLVIPLMRDFLKIIKLELSSRRRTQKRSDLRTQERGRKKKQEERAQLERQRERARTSAQMRQQEKKRAEESRIELQQMRRRRKEIRRKQYEDFKRQLRDPVWGPMLRDELDRAEATAEAKEAETWIREEQRRRRAGKASAAESVELGDEDEDDPFEGDAFRVSVFGKNNQLKSASQPWSDEKMNVFLDFMRYNRGQHIPMRHQGYCVANNL